MNATAQNESSTARPAGVGAISRHCLVCESYLGCRGDCRGCGGQARPACFQRAEDHPGNLDPDTGNLPDEFLTTKDTKDTEISRTAGLPRPADAEPSPRDGAEADSGAGRAGVSPRASARPESADSPE